MTTTGPRQSEMNYSTRSKGAKPNKLNILSTPVTKRTSLKPSSTKVATPCTPQLPVSPALPKVPSINLYVSPEPKLPINHNLTWGSSTTLGLKPQEILKKLYAVPPTARLSDFE